MTVIQGGPQAVAAPPIDTAVAVKPDVTPTAVPKVAKAETAGPYVRERGRQASDDVRGRRVDVVA